MLPLLQSNRLDKKVRVKKAPKIETIEAINLILSTGVSLNNEQVTFLALQADAVRMAVLADHGEETGGYSETLFPYYLRLFLTSIHNYNAVSYANNHCFIFLLVYSNVAI
jgi:hypothetical protein